MPELRSVIDAKPLDNYCVYVTFDNAATGVFDCSPYLEDPYWGKLKNTAFFNCVKAECGTLTWPEDIDIAPEDIWENCVFSSPRA